MANSAATKKPFRKTRIATTRRPPRKPRKLSPSITPPHRPWSGGPGGPASPVLEGHAGERDAEVVLQVDRLVVVEDLPARAAVPGAVPLEDAEERVDGAKAADAAAVAVARHLGEEPLRVHARGLLEEVPVPRADLRQELGGQAVLVAEVLPHVGQVDPADEDHLPSLLLAGLL